MKTSLAKTGYLVTDAVLSVLARDYVAGTQQAAAIRGSYLSILVAHTKRELKSLKQRRPTQDGSLAAIETVHEHLYGVVLKAVTTPDVAPGDGLDKPERARRAKERNRRTNFARSAKSTLVAAIKHGANIAKLSPESVTKDALRRFYQKGPRSLFDRIADAEKKLESMVTELVKAEEETAQDFVLQMHERMQALVKPVATVHGPLLRPTPRRDREIAAHPH